MSEEVMKLQFEAAEQRQKQVKTSRFEKVPHSAWSPNFWADFCERTLVSLQINVSWWSFVPGLFQTTFRKQLLSHNAQNISHTFSYRGKLINWFSVFKKAAGLWVESEKQCHLLWSQSLTQLDGFCKPSPHLENKAWSLVLKPANTTSDDAFTSGTES